MIEEIEAKKKRDPQTHMLKSFRFMEKRILLNLKSWIINELNETQGLPKKRD